MPMPDFIAPWAQLEVSKRSSKRMESSKSFRSGFALVEKARRTTLLEFMRAIAIGERNATKRDGHGSKLYVLVVRRRDDGWLHFGS